jgi:nucleoside-diphosphate-sugar epimerase
LKRIVVTGANGFIGSHCLPLLEEKGYEVHAFSTRAQSNSKSTHIRWHKVDLLHPNGLNNLIGKIRPSHLLHLAWFVEPGKWVHSAQNYRWVQASLDLLLAFLEQGGQKAAMAGSCAEYDWRYSYCIERLTPLKPSNVYGTCKKSLQQMFQSVINHTELSGVWGRIFFLYGPREYPSRLVSSVIQSLLSEQPAECSHGNQIRDYLYVKDVADAFVTLLDSNITGPVNIASGQPIRLKEIINKIAEKMNRENLIRLGARETAPDEPELLVGDTTRLSKEVGWRPKYNLDQGLEETIKWWKNYFSGKTIK